MVVRVQYSYFFFIVSLYVSDLFNVTISTRNNETYISEKRN